MKQLPYLWTVQWVLMEHKSQKQEKMQYEEDKKS